MLCQHPPFIFVHSDQMGVNATLEQRSTEPGKETQTWVRKTKETPTLYFSGFLVDLLEEIRKAYPILLKKEFPKYRIVQSSLFDPMVGASDEGGSDTSKKNAGFGARELAKAAKGGEQSADSGGEAAESTYGGLVKEVMQCENTVALMPMTPTPERKTRVAFTEPFFDVVSLSIMMKKPVLQ